MLQYLQVMLISRVQAVGKDFSSYAITQDAVVHELYVLQVCYMYIQFRHASSSHDEPKYLLTRKRKPPFAAENIFVTHEVN